jgi:bacteriocin-like protein
MKELSSNQLQAVSGGFFQALIPIAVIIGGVVVDGIRHRKDKDAAKREGMDPTRRETSGF